ncbi:glycosyltransferase [Nocardioides aurantiacus]|uniref:glycosyltransferase n=1 Tax=Nocardioides aurantiacus TaxID=86796 RepID=UPI001B873D12|nr:glycosyltransferase [Nocardioides aurantiacus]
MTLVTPHGEYGGPVRVAVNQARSLRSAGWDVVLVGAHRGWGSTGPPTKVDGVPTMLWPARTLVPGAGFAGVGSPGLWRWVRRHARDFDVVHVHLARDLVTLPAAWLVRRLGVPYVLQTHGMVDATSNPLAVPLDAAMTRPVLRSAGRVLHLTLEELHGLQQVVPSGLRTAVLHNGVPLPSDPAGGGSRTVLYLARLAPRKRPGAFVEAARVLASRHPDVEFVMVGPDEGEGAAVKEAIRQAVAGGARVSWTGAVAPENTEAAMRQACSYVLPAVDEPYPMSVLEAMALSLPVLVTDSCGLAPAIARAGAGIVVDASQESLVEALDRLLSDPVAAAAMGIRGRALVQQEMDMAEVADRLSNTYIEVISPG